MEPFGTIEPGRAVPLGATVDAGGVNFALFSAHATKVELCLFDHAGQGEIGRIALPMRDGDIWHGYLPGAKPGLTYGYRVHGPYAPLNGHRFNPNKLLIDPYVRELTASFVWNDIHCGYQVGDADADLSFDFRDNAASMPKCRIVEPLPPPGPRPRTPIERSVIYETHLRGFTMRHPDLPAALRGTAGALRHPEVLSYLRDLGVTAIELLPINPIVDTRMLARAGLNDYWGYNAIAYFAIEPRYLHGGTREDFRRTIEACHNAGIEVILDLVFNHTGEVDVLGPTLCYRGLDNAAYYAPHPDGRRYRDDTGCGHSLNFDSPAVQRMAMDALRYWAGEMGVDGFRFDLAVTTARRGGAFDPGAPFLACIRQDPLLAEVKMIAEPWDLGPDGYRLGGFPKGFSEWNDKFRDDARRFWRGDAGFAGALASRLTGSSDMFGGRRPTASVNFITAHDGFTLEDLVSYASKHNEANGEANRDGAYENFSANHGVEGASDDPAILAARAKAKRNLIATLLLSQGVPMLAGGDEIGRTQGGNNNAYCQDNEIGWLDWSLRGKNADFLSFVQRLVRLRADHPVFRRRAFFEDGPSRTGQKDVVWLTPEGRDMREADWNDLERRAFAVRFSDRLDDGTEGGAKSFLLMVNAADAATDFVLPEGRWTGEFDTAGTPAPFETRYPLAGRALALLSGL